MIEEEVIEFVKKNHDDFVNNEYPKDLVEQMTARKFRDWCGEIGEAHNFLITPFMRKYFDFQQLLKYEWKYSASGGGEEYYLVRETIDKKLEFIYEEDFNWYYMNCWIVTIPTY